MTGKIAVAIIEQKFKHAGGTVLIPKLKGGVFLARLGNLANQPFLPWVVYEETVDLLVRQCRRAERGTAMSARLGAPGLQINSIEGHVAKIVSDKKPGEFVFRRITPIACILIWAGLCESAPNELILK